MWCGSRCALGLVLICGLARLFPCSFLLPSRQTAWVIVQPPEPSRPTQVPSNLRKLHFSIQLADPCMRNWGSTQHHCSHEGASFRPSSASGGVQNPYGFAQLKVGVMKYYQHFSMSMIKKKMKIKHVTKQRCLCSYLCDFTAALVSWEHKIFTLYMLSQQQGQPEISQPGLYIMCYILWSFYYRQKVVCSYRKKKDLMFSIIIFQHLNIKLVYLWIAFCQNA